MESRVCVLTSYNGVPQIVYLDGNYDKAQVALEEALKQLRNVLVSKVAPDAWGAVLAAYDSGARYGNDVVPPKES